MKNEIKEIMRNILKVEISDDSNRQNIDVWDSFNRLDILVNIEKKYGISFSPEEMAEINSYEDIYRIVKSKTDEQ